MKRGTSFHAVTILGYVAFYLIIKIRTRKTYPALYLIITFFTRLVSAVVTFTI